MRIAMRRVLAHSPWLVSRVARLRARLAGKPPLTLQVPPTVAGSAAPRSLPQLLPTLERAKAVLAGIAASYDPEKEHSPEEYEYKQRLATQLATLIQDLQRNCRGYLYRPPIEWWMHGDPVYHLEAQAAPQAALFMVDIHAALLHLIQQFPEGYRVEVLDAGGGCGTGSHLLGLLAGSRVNMSVLDHFSPAEPYARATYPELEFINADLLAYRPTKSWDIVLSSHTIEHFEDPLPVIAQMQKWARHFVVLYAPYNERKRIVGHLFTFTPAVVKGLKPLWMQRVTSITGWRCFLAVLKGKARC